LLLEDSGGAGGAALTQIWACLGPIWAWAGQIWHPEICSRRLVELPLLRVARTSARGLQRGHGSFTSPAGSAGPEGPGLLL
jgi:hypothetical protein